MPDNTTNSAVHPTLLSVLEEMVPHLPVSAAERASLMERLDGLRDPGEKAARDAEKEAARQAEIRAQIEALQAQLNGAPAAASPGQNARG